MREDTVIAGLEARGLLPAVRSVVLAFHVTMREAAGNRRWANVTRARHAAWWYLRSLGFSYPEIGLMWGVHHASVIQALREVSPESVSKIEAAIAKLRETE